MAVVKIRSTALVKGFRQSTPYVNAHRGKTMVLMLGGEALKALGVHAFKAEQIKAAFHKMDAAHRDNFYQEWLKGDEENRFSTNYLDLFVEMEERIVTAIKRDRHSGHDTSESGWTPPPKDYLDDFS